MSKKQQVGAWLIWILAIVFISSSSGCEEKRRKGPKCNCPPPPTSYVVNLQFKDYEGDIQTVPYKIVWSDRSYRETNPPTHIYEIEIETVSGIEHFYSFYEPEKVEDFPNVMKFYATTEEDLWIYRRGEVQRVRPIELFLIEADLHSRKQEQATSWKHYHNHRCPYHTNRRGW